MEKRLVPHGVITNEVINLNSHIIKVERRQESTHARRRAEPRRERGLAGRAVAFLDGSSFGAQPNSQTLAASSNKKP